MAPAIFVALGLIALAVVIIMLWGASGALFRAVLLVWRLLTKPPP